MCFLFSAPRLLKYNAPIPYVCAVLRFLPSQIIKKQRINVPMSVSLSLSAPSKAIYTQSWVCSSVPRQNQKARAFLCTSALFSNSSVQNWQKTQPMIALLCLFWYIESESLFWRLMSALFSLSVLPKSDMLSFDDCVFSSKSKSVTFHSCLLCSLPALSKLSLWLLDGLIKMPEIQIKDVSDSVFKDSYIVFEIKIILPMSLRAVWKNPSLDSMSIFSSKLHILFQNRLSADAMFSLCRLCAVWIACALLSCLLHHDRTLVYTTCHHKSSPSIAMRASSFALCAQIMWCALL